MFIFFLIFLPEIISAQWNIVKTPVSPKLVAINESYVYVDYSEVFIVDFSEIEYAEVLSHGRFINSKAARNASGATSGSPVPAWLCPGGCC